MQKNQFLKFRSSTYLFRQGYQTSVIDLQQRNSETHPKTRNTVIILTELCQNNMASHGVHATRLF